MRVHLDKWTTLYIFDALDAEEPTVKTGKKGEGKKIAHR